MCGLCVIRVEIYIYVFGGSGGGDETRGLFQCFLLVLPGTVCWGEVPGALSLGFPTGAVVDVSSAKNPTPS